MERPRTWVDVDLKAIAHNISTIKSMVGPAVKFTPVIKANGYGCGAQAVAEVALASGADWLGVEVIEEAVDLRKFRVRAPLVTLGFSEPAQAETIVDLDVRPTVRDWETMQAVEAAAGRAGRTVRVHMEVETGLSRLGTPPEEFLSLAQGICACPHLELEGIWAHFASSDDADPFYTRFQFEQFSSVLARLAQAGIHPPVRHIANSSAIVKFKDMRMNMVRSGRLVFGIVPANTPIQDIRPAVTWKSRIVAVRKIKAGTAVSYGCTWKAERDSVYGVVPVGYLDGYSRLLSNQAEMLVCGRRAPVIGKVCMTNTMVDLTDLPGVGVGEEVVIMGKQGQEEVTIYELTRMSQVSEAIFLVGISPIVPRYYV